MTNKLGSRTKKSQAKTINVGRYGEKTVRARVGSVVALETENGKVKIGEKLLPGDDFTCSGWEGCDFRYPNPIAGWEESRAIACNVHITGRIGQTRGAWDSEWVRVKIEWVQDCEPNTFSSGWLLVKGSEV